MKIIKSPVEMTAWSNKVSGNQTIALVPTMGCFHDGHLCLMRMAKKIEDLVVVSLFVNPIQFGPNEDFDSYPGVFESDKDFAEKEGVDILFVPDADEIYSVSHQTSISVKNLTKGLCGKDRPGHFNGVSTIVAKLFNIIKPDSAIFGEKDFQQLSVIRRMVQDLNWEITIVGHPVVREPDGLAMSSRNVYLTPAERQSALRLSQLISILKNRVKEGRRDVSSLLVEAEEYLCIDNSIKIDYIEIIDENTLQNKEQIDEASVIALAVKIGKTRLIDNSYLLKH